MLSKVKALVPRAAKSRLKLLLDYARHAPTIIQLRMRQRRQFAVNLVSRDRRVTFVSEAPNWREMKLAYALKRAGWEVSLLFKTKAPSVDFKSFHDARQFETHWDAVDLAHQAKTRLFHNFSYSGDQTSVRLMKDKPGRVIFDSQDNLFSMEDGFQTSEVKKKQIADQIFCLENADANCCRDMQMHYWRKKTKLGHGKPLILFPDYCWNDGPLPPRRKDDEIHIVQVGWMGLETRNEIDCGAFLIFEKFVLSGCHLHIYLHPIYPPYGTEAYEIAFADYIALGKKTGRVHLHPTIGPAELSGELMKYDFGASVNNALVFDIPWTSHNPARFPYCGSSRLFDYLDAGLGIIIHDRLQFMTRSFRSSGAVQDAGRLLDGIDIRAELRRRPDRDAFQKARDALSVGRNIVRLTRFYEKLR